MAQRLYVVTYYDYDGCRIYGVFSTREKAQACFSTLSEFDKESSGIDEIDLDRVYEMGIWL